MKKSIAIVGLLACAPVWAAEGLSYNYVQANWIADSELDGTVSTDGDGFDVGGVFSFSDTFYVLGEYKDLSYDGGDLEETSVGVGAHSNTFTGGIDVFGNLTFENVDAGALGDDSGFGIEVGARTALGASADGYISYEYDDVGDLEGNFFKIGGSFAFNPNWAITGEYLTGDYENDNVGESDRDDLRVGVRYNF